MLHDENNKLFLNIPIIKIGEGSTSKVYRLSKDRCVKIYSEPCNKKFSEELEIIRNLKLANFYEIYSMLYNKKSAFVGYLMKHYKKRKYKFTYYANGLFIR